MIENQSIGNGWKKAGLVAAKSCAGGAFFNLTAANSYELSSEWKQLEIATHANNLLGSPGYDDSN